MDGYIEFYKFGITTALQRAENLWEFENSYYWNGEYYGYTGANGLYECEAGGFEQIIWKLYDYDPTIPDVQNLLTDVNSRYLDNLWNSPQWNSYVDQHANSNPQRRLENTQMTWQSLMGTYSLLPQYSQAEINDLLNGSAYATDNGNGVNMPAWSLLSNPSAELYDPTTGLYCIHSGVTPSEDATALAENMLMDMGIIQTTASLAVPLEELRYEYNYNIIDKDLYDMDFNSNSIKIPLSSSGEITFLFGSTPTVCKFDRAGLWNVTFSSDWNTVENVTYLGPLPSNRMYYPTSLSNSFSNASPDYCCVQQGFELPINATVHSGLNTIVILANSTIVWNSTISLKGSTTQVTCEVPTTDLQAGNYTISLETNGETSQATLCSVTYPGDLNGDFTLNFNDITLFISEYFAYYTNGTFTPAIDYNHDGTINFNDITLFVSYYLNYYQENNS